MAGKIDYAATSKLRRKVKTKLVLFKDKVKKELSHAINDLAAADSDDNFFRFKKVVANENSGSVSSLNTSDSQVTFLTDCEKRVLDIVSSSSDDDDDDGKDSKAKYKVLLEDEEDNFIERFNKFFQKSTKSNVEKSNKFKVWKSVVTVILIEAKDLSPPDPNIKALDPYCMLRLGNEICKSRVVWKSLNPRWLQQIDLHLFDDTVQLLEISIWDKDNMSEEHLGRCLIDLSTLEREKTHTIHQQLLESTGSLHLLLTISGITASGSVSDMGDHSENELNVERYFLKNTLSDIKDVGHLVVKVFQAQGLTATNFNGESDTFCLLELGNARVRTQTEYKTLTPSWNKIFNFSVKDISDVLELTVFDVDRYDEVEFLGKIAIPLLRIKNGEMIWYSLKNKSLRRRAKGDSPKILLQMTITWNPIRACIRTLNPKEEKYTLAESKFNRKIFIKNILRLKLHIMYLIEGGKAFRYCIECESILQSFAGLLVWLAICYFFQPWMIPAYGLAIMAKQYLNMKPTEDDETPRRGEAEDKENQEKGKKNLKNKLRMIQEGPQDVQNVIGGIVSFFERFKNLINFTVPYTSFIMMIMLAITTVILYTIHLRYCLMIIGIALFVKKIMKPHAIPNNEIMDLLSRVPDDEMVLDYKELKVIWANGTEWPPRPDFISQKP